jgi:hypothetical protein
LNTFYIPEDYQQRILEAQQELEKAYSDAGAQKERLERQLKRAKELYEWGDYSKAEYETRRDKILDQLSRLIVPQQPAERLEKMARFLADVPAAWAAATPEQRNKLARCLFDQVWLKDKEVVAVKPLPELEPFFRLNYEEFCTQNIEDRGSTRPQLPLKRGLTLWILSDLPAMRSSEAASPVVLKLVQAHSVKTKVGCAELIGETSALFADIAERNELLCGAERANVG